jgi:hypothetical protein
MRSDIEQSYETSALANLSKKVELLTTRFDCGPRRIKSSFQQLQVQRIQFFARRSEQTNRSLLVWIREAGLHGDDDGIATEAATRSRR